MIILRWQADCEPAYQTELSAGADLKARVTTSIPPGAVVKVPTGVWIDRVDWENVPAGAVPEIQVRARSGLAFKHGITLANAVGTVDADFPDEFEVLLWNVSTKPYEVKAGDRIAQLVLGLSYRLPHLVCLGKRMGGFGSTGRAKREREVFGEGEGSVASPGIQGGTRCHPAA